MITWANRGLRRRPPSAPRRGVADGESAAVEVTVAHWTGVRAAALSALGRSTSTRLRVEVTSWAPPTASWSGRVGHVPGLVSHRVRVSGSGVVVDLETAEPTDVGSMLLAVLPVLVPHRPAHGTLTPEVHVRAGLDPDSGWTYPLGTDASGPGAVANDHVRTADVVVSPPSDLDSHMLDTVARVVVGPEDADLMLADGRARHLDAHVDPLVHRPTDLVSNRPGRALNVEVAPGRVTLGTIDDPHRSIDLTRGLRAKDVSRLAGFDRVEVPPGSPTLPANVVRALVRLSACGLVVHAPDVDSPRVAAELRALWSERLPERVDPLDLVAASVRQRRAAHRHHSVDQRLRAVAADVSHAPAAPGVSILLTTMRPHLLEFVLDQIARFDYPRMQLVLGLHTDQDPPPSLAARLAALPCDTVLHRVGSKVPFGTALGEVTARADGELVTKLDDDDYYGPSHLWDLVLAHRWSGATVVGKSPEYVYLEPIDTTVRRPVHEERYCDVVAGGTMLMSAADLASIGGWRPVPRSVDRVVLDRTRRAGGLIYRTTSLGYLYVRKGDGHTWDPGLGHFLRGHGEQWRGLLRHAEFGTDRLPAR